MRIVIDKDYPDRKLLQEAYEKKLPTYKILAVESDGEKFVYGKELLVNEVGNVLDALQGDQVFKGCQAEVVECSYDGKKKTSVWESTQKSIVTESGMAEKWKNAWNAMRDAVKETAHGLVELFKDNPITKYFKNKIEEWRKGNYITDNDELTGLGYKVAIGEVEPQIVSEADGETEGEPAKDDAAKDKDDGGEKKADKNAELKENLKKVWDVKVSQCVQALKQQGFQTAAENITGITTHGDKEPVQIQAKVKTKDGDEAFLMMTQQGDIAQGDGKGNANDEAMVKADDADKPDEEGDGKEEGDGEKEEGAEKGDEEKAQQFENLKQRVDTIEKSLNMVKESTNNWNFNDQMMTNKAGIERATIKRFFNELNDGSVKEIKFVSESGNVKTYETAKGSASYAEFKKDFKESTSNAVGKCEGYKVTIESGHKSGLKGFKFSNFGMDDDFDSDSKVVVIRENWLKSTPENDGSKKESVKEEVVGESTKEELNAVNESFTLELDKQDPTAKVKALVASINKYGGQMECPDFEASVSTGVSTYPDVGSVKVSDEVVTEAEGDDEPDPFANDTDTGDAGGGEGDAGGGDAGDAGGGDDNPFGDPGDGAGDAGGDAGGGDPFGGDAGGGADAGGGGSTSTGGGDIGGGGADTGTSAGGDAGAEGGDEATGEPGAPDAVNTDAQGNEKSQYNINVTRPFNTEDDFSLNEEEQKEFFGKIDQLVKIPDMDNYSLYLYQITPENMNLDDVHYIEALYQLSVKLGLLEDIYADSNLLEKYNSYKYSVVKDGENAEQEENELNVQEQSNPIWGNNKVLSEASDKKEGVSKVQDDNQAKNEESKKIGSSEKDDERRGPKDMKLDLDKNGAPKPVVIDTTKEGWDSLNGKEHGKAIDSTVEGDFHGLGWIATFKAMQFGSPRYLSLYIKRNGKGKAEEQCKKYLEKLSYTDIEFVNIDEVDPYEYIYRSSASGMKTPETVRTEKYANEGVPVTYLESKEPESVPKDVKRDIKKVITKLNAEIRNTKQFNFMNETGVFKPQIDYSEFLTHYRTAQINETLSETTYKFVLKKNDSTLSRMFFSNMKEKLFKYLATFATKYNMECGCEATPNSVVIDFMRSDIGNPGYDLDTMVDTDDPDEVDGQEEASVAPTLDQAMEIAKKM